MTPNFSRLNFGLATALILLVISQATFGLKDRSVGRAQPNLKQNRDKWPPKLLHDQEKDRTIVSGQVIQSRRQYPEISKLLRNYDLIKLDPRAAATQIRKTGRMNLNTSRRHFDLQLERYDMRSGDYIAQTIGANGQVRKLPKLPTETYKGSVLGIEGAQARMAVKDASVEGAIITANERFFIQPARSLSKSAGEDEFVFYESSELIEDAGSCGVTLADEVAQQAVNTDIHSKLSEIAQSSTPVTSLSPLKIVRFATDADAEYVMALGGAAQANTQIINIMNMVDGIYQVQIGITFQIVFQNTWLDAATDPYASTAPSTLLSEFRNNWNANFSNVQRNLAHLWTGKDLDSTTIGIASLAVVCRSPQSAYGLSQRFPVDASNPVTAQTVVLTAHEIGHNFSAVHTNQVDPNVPRDMGQTCEKTIMLATINNGSAFCPFSRSQIIGHANAYSSCLTDSSSPAPTSSCVETPIAAGTTNGIISNTDCPSASRGPKHFADRYTFEATAGQQIVITMSQTSGTLDPYLFLIAPDGYVIDQADFGIGINARIPEASSGPFTLSQTGRYVIEATSSLAGQTGNYELTLAFNGCALGVAPTALDFPASGGIGRFDVAVSGPCSSYAVVPDPTTGGSNWVLLSEGAGSGPRSFSFIVSQNSNAAGRRMFVLVGPSEGNSDHGGLRILVTQSGTGPDCSVNSITFGQTSTGDLSTNDCQSPIRGNAFYSDRYSFAASAGQQVGITLTSSNAPTTDTFLSLIGPNGVVILTDDASGGVTNSRIPGGPGFLTLGLPGTYIIEVGTFNSGMTGPYALTLTTTLTPPLQLILEESGPAVNQAAALESVLFLRDPFPVVNSGNFFTPGTDRNTRVVIFATNLQLTQDETSSSVVVNLVDTNNQSYDIPAEDVRPVPNFNFTQVIFRLPTNLPVGTCTIKVKAHAQVSNSGTMRIRI